MTPERFHRLNAEHGPLAGAMSIEMRTDHMGSAWIIYLTHSSARVDWREVSRHVVAMFASTDVFGACQLAALRRIESA